MSTNKTVAYQCPCCGAGLGFDPEKQKFACEFCLSEFDEAELTNAGAAEAAEKQRAEGEAFCEQMNLFTCPNCGAAKKMLEKAHIPYQVIYADNPEGMSFAILIMIGVVPLINRYMKPKRFGERRADK